jgi:prepilin signal peptidase PulO-like enzyme (type II secretory pathway)
MNTLFYISLFIIWALFWSFASVLIYRLKSWKKWILNGRSNCPKCKNILWPLELIPIISWLKNLWKCKYCKEKISIIYPLLEISTWILFALIWYFLIDYNLILNWDLAEVLNLIFWLSIWFITILYIFYDILFLEIHEWIMLSSITISLTYIITNTFLNNEILISIYAIILSLAILVWLYIIMLKELKIIWDLAILTISIIFIYLFKIIFNIDLNDIQILSSIVWALGIFLFFFLQIWVSDWRAMWWWDLRIAILVWLLLAINLSFAGVMITYLVWSLVWIWIIIYSKIKNGIKKKVNTRIPFGPFLWIWFFITIFYQNQILNLMSIYF